MRELSLEKTSVIYVFTQSGPIADIFSATSFHELGPCVKGITSAEKSSNQPEEVIS